MMRFIIAIATALLPFGSSLAEAEPVESIQQEKARPIWIEAEDFSDLGGWIRTPDQTALMGRTTGKSGEGGNKILTASTKIKVAATGSYKLWVRSYGSKNAKVPRDFGISIDSVASAIKLGAHGNDGWAWESAGVFPLEKGEISIELIDTSQYYARCDKLLLTPDHQYVPKGTGGDRNAEHVRAADQLQPLYVRATFNDLNVGSLAGQSGGEGFRTNSAWSVQGGINTLAGDLRLPATDGREYIRSQNGTPCLLQAGIRGESHAIRPLAAPMNGRLWFRFLVKPQGTFSSAGIKLLPSADPAQGYKIVSEGADLSFLGPDATQTGKIENVFPVGKTSVVVGCMDMEADRDGRRSLSLWVNPDVEKPGPALMDLKLSDTMRSITHLALVVTSGKTQATSPALDEVVLTNHPYPTGYFQALPRKRHFGQWHIPVKLSAVTTQLPPSGYRLVFSDEFDSGELDRTKWTYRLRDKADSAQQAENVEVRDGNLIIHARKEQVGRYNYTGGGIISKELFVYGYYEARFKIPSSEGWHTAFWTMPEYDPVELRNTEIDFCEQDSGDPHYFSLGLINHREKGWNRSNIGRWVVEDAPNMVEQYVVIAAEFTPATIRFYMNGRLAKEVDSRLFPHGPATVQLSCIASRKKGDRFQDDARLPSQATFDYVRIYQHPRYAEAEAAAKARVVLPTKPLPPLQERQRPDAKIGNLD